MPCTFPISARKHQDRTSCGLAGTIRCQSHDSFIQIVYMAILTSEVSTFNPNYCRCWSLGHSLDGVDERDRRPRSLSPARYYLFIQRCISGIQKPLGLLSLGIFVSWMSQHRRLGSERPAHSHESLHICKMYQGVSPWLAEEGLPVSWGSGVGTEDPNLSQHATHILVSEAAETAMLETVSSRPTLGTSLGGRRA